MVSRLFTRQKKQRTPSIRPRGYFIGRGEIAQFQQFQINQFTTLFDVGFSEAHFLGDTVLELQRRYGQEPRGTLLLN